MMPNPASGSHSGLSSGLSSGLRSGSYKGSASDMAEAPDRERWLLSYADLLTLLLAFFVVMYSMSEVDVTKLSSISESFSGGVKSVEMGPGEVNSVSNVDTAVVSKDASADTPQPITKTEMLASLFDGDVAVNEGEGDWVLVTMDSSVLFRSGSADVVAINALRDIALTLSVYDGEIIVEGHTDATPISTERFPSNWELSAARAAAVVRLLESAGISSSRLNATGLADTRPLMSNETAEGRERNRRVVFRLKRNALNAAALATATSARENEIADPIVTEEYSDEDFASEFDLDDVDPELLLQLLEQIERESDASQDTN